MQAVHLVILIHGLYGSTLNLSAVEQELLSLAATSESASSSPTEPRTSTSSSVGSGTTSQQREGGSSRIPARDGVETIVYLPKGIKGARTWDGIDVCAQRIAEEVDKEIERLQDEGKDVIGFSVMGYSLGGLIARYLIGILYARQPSFFARHKPVSFSTAATPHLGVLKYGTLTNTVVHTVGRRVFSRTGRQLYVQDKEAEWGGRGLLEVMADPGASFVRALRLFPKVMIVANGSQDLTVPYPTASISSHDPFQDTASLHIEVDDDHIVQSYRRDIIPDPDDLPVDHRAEVDDEDGEAVEVTIRVIKSGTNPSPSSLSGNHVARFGIGGRVRQPLPPPFMLLPWPFNYLLFVIFPLLVPLFLVYAATALSGHTYLGNETENENETEPLLRPPSRQSSNPAASVVTQSRSNRRETDFVSGINGRSTPPLSEPIYHSPTAPLLLTPAQKMMIKNLNSAIPHAERVISWFPWAYNSHAMLICRDTARFPWQEDGRGVVRRWTRFVFNAGLEVLHKDKADGGEIHERIEVEG
ncbi:hypothetical protein I317_05624 [Kwoniella heveanensis CBS 569]|nr:hypothetical protein I317_05624 [Kwoniella heveanensis CBS 569]